MVVVRVLLGGKARLDRPLTSSSPSLAASAYTTALRTRPARGVRGLIGESAASESEFSSLPTSSSSSVSTTAFCCGAGAAVCGAAAFLAGALAFGAAYDFLAWRASE